MTASKQQRILSVRLPEEQLRRLKSRAAARGQSLRAAVGQAVEAWMARPEPAKEPELAQALASLRGCLAGSDVWEQRRRDKEHEWRHDEQLGRRTEP